MQEAAGQMKDQTADFVLARKQQTDALASVRMAVADELELLRKRTQALKKQVADSEKALQQIVSQFTIAADVMALKIKAP